MKQTVWGNCIVKNEGRYLWFAVESVVNYLDKIIIWDTGSNDSTLEIVKLLQKKYPKKIDFQEIGEVDKEQFTAARQKMLELTQSDWVFILDGDEVWWKDSIEKIVEVISQKGDKLYFIVNPYYSVVGDIYHYQENDAGQYKLLGRTGHLNIRAINRKIPGLHLGGAYPNEALITKDEIKIQDLEPQKAIYVEAPYLHFSNIQRASNSDGDPRVMQRTKKIRYEIGLKFPKNFKYPEVFYVAKPAIVPNPWVSMSKSYRLRAIIETPLRKLKRKIR